ncbi:pilus assembly FimT family protein [Xylophilus sp.]|uniref:pilus assembly FimT family protein n=1 Tax=Xylophilus sp. TaxID=2653893 RepID=UPI002D81124C|nr:GspH/FimT family pseudopilin [Xylophilus sp.]
MAMRASGFTLVEVMVTLAVAALLLLVAAPGIGGWMVDLRVREAADTLHAGLQTARQEAVRRNENVSFWLVSASGAALSSACTLSSSSASWVVSLKSPVGACAATPSTTTAPKVVASQALATSALTVAATRADARPRRRRSPSTATAAWPAATRPSPASTSPPRATPTATATCA